MKRRRPCFVNSKSRRAKPVPILITSTAINVSNYQVVRWTFDHSVTLINPVGAVPEFEALSWDGTAHTWVAPYLTLQMGANAVDCYYLNGTTSVVSNFNFFGGPTCRIISLPTNVLEAGRITRPQTSNVAGNKFTIFSVGMSNSPDSKITVGFSAVIAPAPDSTTPIGFQANNLLGFGFETDLSMSFIAYDVNATYTDMQMSRMYIGGINEQWRVIAGLNSLNCPALIYFSGGPISGLIE